MQIRLATRGSRLALAQSGLIADALRKLVAEVELVRVRTLGDVSTAPLSSLGGVGVFVAAVREAVLAGDCDLAVHSLKDLPTTPAEGLTIAAIPEREDARDALCARNNFTLDALPAGSWVGTGSPRRAAQLALTRPDLRVADIRGNVDTRLARVGKDLDAVVLAAAGLHRLGLAGAITRIVETYGAAEDRSGKPGVDQARVDAFFAAAQEVSDWHARAATQRNAEESDRLRRSVAGLPREHHLPDLLGLRMLEEEPRVRPRAADEARDATNDPRP